MSHKKHIFLFCTLFITGCSYNHIRDSVVKFDQYNSGTQIDHKTALICGTFDKQKAEVVGDNTLDILPGGETLSDAIGNTDADAKCEKEKKCDCNCLNNDVEKAINIDPESDHMPS